MLKITFTPCGCHTPLQTAATLVAFICAMILHPEVQKRAHAELDRVVGPGRLPEHTDRAALPYVDALVKEMIRWHNVGPLGVAHRCMEEDVYRGWRIPKGAIVMPNAWWVVLMFAWTCYNSAQPGSSPAI